MKNIARISVLVLVFSIVSFAAKAVTAGFTASVTEGCAPLVVYFTNTSSGATTYLWDFGSGAPKSPIKDPSTSYTTPGVYKVKLVATSGGVSDSTTMTIIVNPAPTVSFTSSATSVCPGIPVTFTSTTSGGVPGAITYTWAFGDGGISTLSTPVHSYGTPGTYNITLTATNSKGCVASLTVPSYITVFKAPVADFGAVSTTLCKPPSLATFTNLSSGTPALTYSWDMGDGGTSTLVTPTHSYTASGSYTVQLITTDGNGCKDTISKPAYINVGTMTAAFTAPTTICANSMTNFPNTSSPHISSDWSYGDGGTDITEDGNHSYSTPGTYTVRLIISDGTCKDTITHIVKVVPGPVISFTISPHPACPPPVAITFTGTAPTGTSVSWSFDDGTFGTGKTVTHTYYRKGVCTVLMYCTDPATGCATQVTKNDTLYDMDFHVIASPVMGCKPLPVKFDYTAYTHAPDTTLAYPYPYIATTTWTFGDGTPSSSLAKPTHVYTDTGTFIARLTVVTTNGCVFTDTIKILVGAPPVVKIIGTPTDVCFKGSIAFYMKLISGPIDEEDWDPGKGAAGGIHYSTGDDTYTATYDRLPGTFRIIVTPSYHGCPGKPDTSDFTVTIDSPMSFISAKILCSPMRRVVFTNLSLGADTWLWMFGDGSTSTVKNPIHDYALNKPYTASLATYNVRSGCRDTFIYYIDLSHPTVTFSASKTALCRDAVDTLTAKVTGGPVYGYLWLGGGTFPDSTVSPPKGSPTGKFGPIITDTFHVSGLYTMQLVTYDKNGCADTITKPNYITVAQPIPFFTATPPNGCWPLTATFTDVSSDAPGVVMSKYKWAFGDGATATTTSASVVHTFTAAGVFSTKEIVTDNIGCTDSITMALVTVWRPHADFNSYKYPCVGDKVTFTNTSTSAVSYYWTFGDGGTSTVTSPVHIYTAAGTYTVSLAVVDVHGCMDTAKFVGYITATEVHASFYMDDSIVICPPMVVNFTNTSTGASTYYWDMGDGTSSIITNPSDLYITPGVYIVKLTSTNMYGCSATDSAKLIIYGYSGALTYAPLTGCAPLNVHFKASISNVPSIIWDFSDGTTSPPSKLDTADHVYTLPGAYVPKLILSDGTGCQNSSIGLDTIKVDAVIPDFGNAPDPICVNGLMNFIDKSKSYFSTITAWSWVLSDGTTSNVSAPSFTYTVAGTFPVSLIATDGWGCTDSITKNVTVIPPQEIKACADTVICVSDFATLYVSGGVSYSWSPSTTLDCSTCGTGVKANPSSATTYTVTGVDRNGCTNSDTVLVSLKTKTEAHPTGDTEICSGMVVRLHDSGGTSYTWIPGTSLNDPNAAEPFANPTTTTRYRVIAYLGSCIPDTGAVWVKVHPLPTVDAGPDQKLVEGSIAQLQATGNLIEKYSWDADPTLSCTECAEPSASMSVTTTYAVHVASDFGCTASDTVTIHIYCDQSQIFVPNTFTPNGDGQNDVFYPRGVGVKIVKSFRIYNRWGELLFERSNIHLNDASQAWDGAYHGNAARPDVYVYILESFCETGEPINIKGDVTVIR